MLPHPLRHPQRVAAHDWDHVDGTLGAFREIQLVASVHAGGEFVVRHGDRSATLDLGTSDPTDLAWAAFYADCLRCAGAAAPDHDAVVAEPTTTLEDDARSQEGWPTKLAFALTHHYTPAGLSFANLKNAGRGVASEAPRRGSCSVQLAMVSITPSRDDDHFEVIEVLDQVLDIPGPTAEAE